MPLNREELAIEIQEYIGPFIKESSRLNLVRESLPLENVELPRINVIVELSNLIAKALRVSTKGRKEARAKENQDYLCAVINAQETLCKLMRQNKHEFKATFSSNNFSAQFKTSRELDKLKSAFPDMHKAGNRQNEHQDQFLLDLMAFYYVIFKVEPTSSIPNDKLNRKVIFSYFVLGILNALKPLALKHPQFKNFLSIPTEPTLSARILRLKKLTIADDLRHAADSWKNETFFKPLKHKVYFPLYAYKATFLAHDLRRI